MAKIDKATIKKLLQVDNKFGIDPLLDELIPVVLNWTCDHLRNYFHMLDVDSTVFNGTTISFAVDEAESDTILDSSDGFVTAGFLANDFIHVKQSNFNTGVYRTKTVAAGILTIYKEYDLEVEAVGNTTVIYRMKFPTGFVHAFARVIGFDLSKKGRGVKRFSLGDYSEEYAGMGNYPPGILQMFNPWRRLRV